MRFHCAKAVKKACRKGKHDVAAQCCTVQAIIQQYPEYGCSIRGASELRKMRVPIPGSGIGSSSGFRLIYSKKEIDEEVLVVLLHLYFKSDQSDLSQKELKDLQKRCKDIWSQRLEYEFDASVDG